MNDSFDSEKLVSPPNNRRKAPPFFFSGEEYAILSCFASRMIPSSDTPDDPGAREVGTVNYVDSWILDENENTKSKFRNGLAFIDSKSREKLSAPFTKLPSALQDELLQWMMKDRTGRDYFEALRGACIDGFYSDYRDPNYEGPTAWSLVGFQGKRISDVKKDWTFLRIHRENKVGDSNDC